MQAVLDTITAAGVAVLLLAAVMFGVLVIQIALRYTKPNIGYVVRAHRDREYTFFVRNLDSVHYSQPLHLIVSGAGLTYVAAHAGPWSRGKPEQIDSGDDRIRVRVVLDEIPEDAAFAIRALCTGDVPRIEVAASSPLQTRTFARPLRKFTLAIQLRYYCLRFASGIAVLLTIFLGGLQVYDRGVYPGDYALAILAVILAGLSFALVVPFSGKNTIVGYLTLTTTDHCWGDRTGSTSSLP
jgi:hypothetical protein